MKNYNGNCSVPSIVEYLCNGEAINGFPFYEPIPILRIGRVYYGNVRFKGENYNVVRFKGIFLAMRETYGVREAVTFFCFDTPKGKTIAARFLKGFRELFEDKEDYLEFLATGDSEKNVTLSGTSKHMNVTDMFNPALNTYQTSRNHLVSDRTFYGVRGYEWGERSGQPILNKCTPFKYAWIDEDGPHIIFDADNIYRDRIDCVKANFKLDDDFGSENSNVTQTFKVSVTISVEATTIVEAEKIAKEKVAYITE